MPKGYAKKPIQCVVCGNKYIGNPTHNCCTLRCKLLSKVEPSPDCWLWRGSTRRGYGRFKYLGRIYIAPRAAYEVFYGRAPTGRRCVCHRCDNPTCVNPAHLFLATSAGNTADMVAKNRQAKGSRQHLAKLTEEDVRAIRADPRSSRAIAAQYGISKTAVVLLRNKKTWKHVA